MFAGSKMYKVIMEAWWENFGKYCKGIKYYRSIQIGQGICQEWNNVLSTWKSEIEHA